MIDLKIEDILGKIISRNYWREFAQLEQAKEDYISKLQIFLQNVV